MAMRPKRLPHRKFHTGRLQRSGMTINDFYKGDKVEIRMKTELRGVCGPDSGKVFTGEVVSQTSLMVKVKFDGLSTPPKYVPAYCCFKPEGK